MKKNTGKSNANLKKRKRPSVRRLLASFRKTKTGKKSCAKKADSNHFPLSIIFGVAIPPTDEQYANIASPFVKQR